MPDLNRYKKELGLPELIAIAVGGMVGGGIFTILGISVALIGAMTPFALITGGIVALLAAYSYVKLGVYYRDAGSSFVFFRKTYPKSHEAAALTGWLVIFGYISTLALYAYTFSSYILSSTSFAQNTMVRDIFALLIIAIFAIINSWSVKGMGKIEDLMVYTKLFILLVISGLLIYFGAPNFSTYLTSLSKDITNSPFIDIIIVTSLTFVAYEGFELVIYAMNVMKNPEKNIARSIYSAIILVIFLYVIIAVGALLALPQSSIVANKEFALAAGASSVMGPIGNYIVIFGAMLATSSAISGTLFGASRQMAAISEAGYFPKVLAKRNRSIPVYAIVTMSVFAGILIFVGGLQLLLEFGSITFLLISLLMAIANFKMRKEAKSNSIITLSAIFLLALGGILILYYEFTHVLSQMLFIVGIYVLIIGISFIFAKKKKR